jgi:hypothetical protein
MSEVTKAVELKSVTFATENKLSEAIVLNEANGFDVGADLYDDVVLKKCGITLDQLKKKSKLDGEFLAAATYVGGEQVGERFTANPELHEVSLSIPMGAGTTATAIFTRGQSTVVAMNTKIHSAEMKRVLSHVDALWAEVSA